MQPFIGPPIPVHLLVDANGETRIIGVVLVAVSLLVHVVFLIGAFRILNQWRKDLDKQRHRRQEQERRLDEQERKLDEQERKWREGHRNLDDPVLQLRAATERLRDTLDRIRNAETAS